VLAPLARLNWEEKASLRMSASTPRAGALLEAAAAVRTGGPERQQRRHA